MWLSGIEDRLEGGEGEREVCVACNFRNLSGDGDVLYLDYISVSILPVIL